MYGTVAKFKAKPGTEKQIEDLTKEYESLSIPGYVGEIIFKMNDNPNEFMMAVVFESKESYRKNADDPSQHERFMKWRALLESDPEWHDGEIVYKRM